MDAKLSIKKFKDPNKGNWDVNITGQYLNVVGKIYDFKQYKQPDKIKDSSGNPTDKDANNGYYSGKGELTNLIDPAKPFTNPVTNQQVTITTLQAEFEDIQGWDQMQTLEIYRSYVYASIQKSLEKKYKEAFGVEIELKMEMLPEEKKDAEQPKQPTENQPKSTGTIAKYISTGASNNGVPMEITYEVVKDGISVYKSEMTTGFKYDASTKKITIAAADTFYDMSGKWVEKNGKDPFVAKDQILTLEGYPPAPADAGTNGSSGTSGNGPKIYGEFIFDVQEQETFNGKDFGKLILVAKGVVNVPAVEIPEEEPEEASVEILDEEDEYAEELFEGEEETEPLVMELKNVKVVEAMKKAEEEAENLPPINTNSPNPFNDAKGSGIAPSQTGKGYPVDPKTTKFVNLHTNGIYPAKQHDDGTFVVSSAEGTTVKSRHWLVPNPQYVKLMQTVSVPLSTGKRGEIKVHPEFATKLKAVFEAVEKKGLQKYIFSCAGGLAIRNVTKGTRLSNHSYGFAIDVNSTSSGWEYGAKWNVDKRTVTTSSGKTRNWGEKEEGFYEIVKIMKNYGVGWLGSSDPMHFSIHE